MKKHLLFIIIIALVLFISCNQGITKPEAHKFSGLWELLIIEKQDSASKEWHEYKNGLQGYILYDDKDNMALHLTSKGYQNTDIVFSNFNDTVSIEELKHKAHSYVYFAKYTVDENEKTIEHARISHSNPNEWNTVVKRWYEFKGDTLILTTVENENSPLRVIWIKD